MSKYIDADRLIRRLENRPYKAVPNFIKMINEQEAADVVSRGVLEQVMWERDLAVSQLAEIGKGFGEKMDDVQEVKHGRWMSSNPSAPMFGFDYCSICGRKRTSPKDYYCPNCGAKMDLDGDIE